MKRIKRDKDFILTALADKQDAVEVFIKSNKLNVKNPPDFVRLINYYNTL
jgi:hypothetical protein